MHATCETRRKSQTIQNEETTTSSRVISSVRTRVVVGDLRPKLSVFSTELWFSIPKKNGNFHATFGVFGENLLNTNKTINTQQLPLFFFVMVLKWETNIYKFQAHSIYCTSKCALILELNAFCCTNLFAASRFSPHLDSMKCFAVHECNEY
jgi:hypothetical protein